MPRRKVTPTQCRKCGIAYDEALFSKSSFYCKVCSKVIGRRYYVKNKAELNKRAREKYRRKHANTIAKRDEEKIANVEEALEYIKQNAPCTKSEIARNLNIAMTGVENRLLAIDNLPTGPHLWQDGGYIGVFRA